MTNRAPRGGDSFAIGDSFSRDGFSDDLRGVTMIERQTGREISALHDDGAACRCRISASSATWR